MGIKHLTSFPAVDTESEKAMLSPIAGKYEVLSSMSNASSQTVVNCEWENRYLYEISNDEWYFLICQVFGCFASDTSDSFLEEFHYAVISCDLLNDYHPLRLSKIFSDWSLPIQVEENSSGIHIKNFPYLDTVLRVRRILNLLKSSNGFKRKIVLALLITLHLTFQQEVRRLQFRRRNALKVLKSMLESLQKLMILQHNLLVTHKEVSSRNDSKISPVVKDLLSSSLDLVYYSMLSFTEKLLPISDSSELSKYCEIYDASLPELYYGIKEPARDIEARWSRLKLMRSLMLCCLLSQNHNDSGKNFNFDPEIYNFLCKLFPNYDRNYGLRQIFLINEADRLKLITTDMQHLQNLTASVALSILRHAELINEHRQSIINSKNFKRFSKYYSQPEHKSIMLSQKVSTSLQSLRDLETILLSTDEEIVSNNNSTTKLIKQRLIELLSLWQINYNDVENTNYSRKNRISMTKFGNRGLSLDVLQNPQNSTTICGGPHLQSPSKLGDRVAFTAVEDTQSDIELDSDNDLQKLETTNAGCDEEAIYSKKRLRSSDKNLIDNRIAKFKSLSDEELRHKLNEGISKFARENKQGRQRLRNQKSFELLRKPNSNEFMSVQGALRQISSASEITLNNTCSTEETIPMYYEIQKILDR